MASPPPPRVRALLLLASVLATGCGNVVRERPAFFRTNSIIKAHFTELPSDGLEDYSEPDDAAKVAGRYAKDRLLDLSDILGVSVLGGYGFSINLRATKVVQAGVGWYRAGRAGFMGRHAGAWWENRWEGGISLAYAHSYSVEGGAGPITDHPEWDRWQARAQAEGAGLGVIDFLGQNDRGFLDIGATAFAGGGGLDIELRTAEIGDFLIGLITVDIMRDDTVARERESMIDLAVYVKSERPRDFERFLRSLEDEEREEFLAHSSASVRVAALASLEVTEARRPDYARRWYASFLDEDRGELQDIAVGGLERLTGQDFGYDPDQRREDNQRAIRKLQEWLERHP